MKGPFLPFFPISSFFFFIFFLFVLRLLSSSSFSKTEGGGKERKEKERLGTVRKGKGVGAKGPFSSFPFPPSSSSYLFILFPLLFYPPYPFQKKRVAMNERRCKLPGRRWKLWSTHPVHILKRSPPWAEPATFD